MWQSIWVHNIPFKQVMKDYWTMSTKCLMRMAKWFTTSKGMANMDKTMKLWLMFPLRNVLHLKLKLAWEKEKKKENKSSHSIYISQTSNHWNERRGHVHEIGGFSCSVVGEKMKIYKIKLKSLKRNHQNWNMHWKEDILQRNTRENKGRRKTSTEDTTCVDSALGLGLDPHGAAFGPPVFTQELERSKPWACNRKQLGKERNITLCKPYSSHSSVLQAIKVGTLQTHQHLELLGQPEFSGACPDFESRGLFYISHTFRTLILSTALVWLACLECLTFKNSPPPEKSHLSFAQFKPIPMERFTLWQMWDVLGCEDALWGFQHFQSNLEFLNSTILTEMLSNRRGWLSTLSGFPAYGIKVQDCWQNNPVLRISHGHSGISSGHCGKGRKENVPLLEPTCFAKQNIWKTILLFKSSI